MSLIVYTHKNQKTSSSNDIIINVTNSRYFIGLMIRMHIQFTNIPRTIVPCIPSAQRTGILNSMQDTLMSQMMASITTKARQQITDIISTKSMCGMFGIDLIEEGEIQTNRQVLLNRLILKWKIIYERNRDERIILQQQFITTGLKVEYNTKMYLEEMNNKIERHVDLIFDTRYLVQRIRRISEQHEEQNHDAGITPVFRTSIPPYLPLIHSIHSYDALRISYVDIPRHYPFPYGVPHSFFQSETLWFERESLNDNDDSFECNSQNKTYKDTIKKNLWTRRYKHKLSKNNKKKKCVDNHLSCGICLDFIKKRQDISTTSCDHDFHTKCILKWIDSHMFNGCPMCRDEMEKEHMNIIKPVNDSNVVIFKTVYKISNRNQRNLNKRNKVPKHYNRLNKHNRL